MLDGKDGQFRDAALGWQEEEKGGQQEPAEQAEQLQQTEGQHPQQEGEQAAEQAAPEQPGTEQQQEAEQQPAQQQAEESGAATAMDKLHSLGIRYHEREPGTPAVVRFLACRTVCMETLEG